MRYRWQRLWPWLLAAALVWAAGPAAAAGPEVDSTVSVTGRASLRLKPDRVGVVAGVVTEAPSAQEAAAENAKVMARVREALAREVGEGGELATSGYSVAPRYEWNQDRSRRRLTGFKAVNRLRVTSPAVDRVGSLLDAALAAGANTVDGPEWSLADPSAAMITAQGRALADARAQAEALAGKAGMALGPVLSINAADQGGGPEPQRLMQANRSAPRTPVEPGALEVSARVSCVFALEPK
jgi:hypothetical protein